MITLRAMAYQFWDDIGGQAISADTRFDEREIALKIRQIMNEVMPMKFYEQWNEGDRGAIDIYISSYELVLQKDTAFDRAIITIPDFFQGAPYGRGIHRVFLKKDPYNDFVRSHNAAIGKNLPAGNVKGVNYYYMEGYTMVARNILLEPDDTDEDRKVIVQLLIAAPDKIGINDPLPILPEHQNEILKRLRAQYVPTVPDLTTNGNPTI